jgi:hypothetical protein
MIPLGPMPPLLQEKGNEDRDPIHCLHLDLLAGWMGVHVAKWTTLVPEMFGSRFETHRSNSPEFIFFLLKSLLCKFMSFMVL